MCAHVCVCVSKPKANLGVVPWLLYILFFLNGLSLACISQVSLAGWLSVETRVPLLCSTSSSLVLRWQMCSPVSVIFMWFLGLNSDSVLAQQVLLHLIPVFSQEIGVLQDQIHLPFPLNTRISGIKDATV